MDLAPSRSSRLTVNDYRYLLSMQMPRRVSGAVQECAVRFRLQRGRKHEYGQFRGAAPGGGRIDPGQPSLAQDWNGLSARASRDNQRAQRHLPALDPELGRRRDASVS